MNASTVRALTVTVVGLLLTLVGGPAASAIDAPAVTGRVTFESAGVNDAGIEILSGGTLVTSTTTSATGAYEVAVPAPGVFDVRVDAAGFTRRDGPDGSGSQRGRCLRAGRRRTSRCADRSARCG